MFARRPHSNIPCLLLRYNYCFSDHQLGRESTRLLYPRANNVSERFPVTELAGGANEGATFFNPRSLAFVPFGQDMTMNVTYECPYCGVIHSVERDAYLDDKSVIKYPAEVGVRRSLAGRGLRGR